MTTEELQLKEVTWGDHRIRMIELDTGTFVPVGDIAKVTGVRKRAYHNLMDKNPDVFLKHERGVQLSSPGGSQETRCIDLMGANTLLTRISINHIKNPETKVNLIKFNEWVMQRATGKIVPGPAQLSAPKEPDFDLVLRKLKFVREVHKETGWDLIDMQKRVMEDAGFYSLTHAAEIIKPTGAVQAGLLLPALEKKPKDYLTATDIGERIGKSAEEVHLWMYQRKPPLILRDDVSGWRLTTWGKDYGEERAVELTGGTIVWRIKWKKDVLRLFNIPDGV